jgi:hypothetical protein
MWPGMVVFFSLFALAVGAGAWYLMVSPAELSKTVQPNVAGTLIIFIGAAIGMAYLAFQAIFGAGKLASIMHRGGGDSCQGGNATTAVFGQETLERPLR